MRALYAILTGIVAAVLFPVALAGKLIGKPGLSQRLTPPGMPPRAGRKRLWIHAASVGELGIAQALAAEVRKTDPDMSIVVSTMTATGLGRIRRAMAAQPESGIEAAFFAPLDNPLVTGAFVRAIDPTAFTLVETELWPSLINSLYRAGVPVSLVNGRLGRSAFRSYMILKRIMRPVVGRLALLCVQSRKFSQRYILLGVPPERVEVIGNVKFDGLSAQAGIDAEAARDGFGIPPQMPLLVAGSTRPGEEEVLAQAFKRVLARRPDAGLVLVPRHLNRMPEIAALLEKLGLPFVTRTSGRTMLSDGANILILDTMGDLVRAFACADAAFVGGSLRDFGGHNPLEPASLGKPVLFGPYMEQIGSKELLARGAAALVHGEDDLAALLESLFSDPEKRARMGEAGKGVVGEFQGTLARTVACMIERRVL